MCGLEWGVSGWKGEWEREVGTYGKDGVGEVGGVGDVVHAEVEVAGTEVSGKVR